MRKISDKLKIHFDLSFQMLENVIESCPDNLWSVQDEKNSIWKRFLHVLESIDFWFSDFAVYNFTDLFNGFSAEMDQTNISVISKDKMIRYKNLLQEKFQTIS